MQLDLLVPYYAVSELFVERASLKESVVNCIDTPHRQISKYYTDK